MSACDSASTYCATVADEPGGTVATAAKDSFGNMLMSRTLRGSVNIEQMTLTELDVRGSNASDVAPPLFEPVLVAMGGTGILLRGYELAEGTAYVQEWGCELCSED